MLKIGEFQVYSIVTGTIALDGGAMYGVVPKVLWSKVEKVDELNRIKIAMRTLLAINKKTGLVILVDGGAGDKWPQNEMDRYAIENRPHAISDALNGLSLSEKDVTDVILTHLHFDHAGGFSYLNENGKPHPRFPNARHWIHKDHWQHANNPTERDKASFLRRNLVFLHSFDLLKFVAGDQPDSTIKGIEWFVSHGHTPFMLLPILQGDPFDLMFSGDLIPNAQQLNPTWSMSYDLFPLTILKERKQVLSRCIKKGMRLAFPHDMKMAGAALMFNGKQYQVKEALIF